MKKYTMIAALFAAGIACANASDLVLDVLGTATSDKYSVAASNPITIDSNTFDITLTPSGGKFWSTTSLGEWTNTSAIEELNTTFGTTYQNSDFNSVAFTYTGWSGSTSDLTLSLSESYPVGSNVVIYTFVTSEATQMGNLSVSSGLKDVALSYAVAGGNGFVSDASWTTGGAKHLTLVKIEGTVTNTSIILDSSTAKNGWAGIGIAAIPVPEPSAFGLLAGIGALALVASRRRRK